MPQGASNKTSQFLTNVPAKIRFGRHKPNPTPRVCYFYTPTKNTNSINLLIMP